MNRKRAAKTVKKFTKRTSKEIKANGESKEFDFSVNAKDPNLWYFRFSVDDGLYKGQQHIIEVKLQYGNAPTPEAKTLYVYPVNPPLCRFITPIWHPNISTKGTICLDVLKDEWTPSMHSAAIVTAIKLLLMCPEPKSPLNLAAAWLFTTSRVAYKKRVSEVYDTADKHCGIFQ